MTVKYEEIATLVEMFESSNWDELHVEIDGLQLFLSTDPNARLTTARHQHSDAPATISYASPIAAAPAIAPRPSAGQPAPAVATGNVPSNWVVVTAPTLGTFYRAPKPGADPYVQLGQMVEADSEICLLEVMKLFTAVKAGVKGTVRQICAKDSDMVEFGQMLFYIEPA